jgi:hypothetical protein
MENSTRQLPAAGWMSDSWVPAINFVAGCYAVTWLAWAGFHSAAATGKMWAFWAFLLVTVWSPQVIPAEPISHACGWPTIRPESSDLPFNDEWRHPGCQMHGTPLIPPDGEETRTQISLYRSSVVTDGLTCGSDLKAATIQWPFCFTKMAM